METILMVTKPEGRWNVGRGGKAMPGLNLVNLSSEYRPNETDGVVPEAIDRPEDMACADDHVLYPRMH